MFFVRKYTHYFDTLQNSAKNKGADQNKSECVPVLSMSSSRRSSYCRHVMSSCIFNAVYSLRPRFA